eukprot:Opistho-1_new@42555
MKKRRLPRARVPCPQCRCPYATSTAPSRRLRRCSRALRKTRICCRPTFATPSTATSRPTTSSCKRTKKFITLDPFLTDALYDKAERGSVTKIARDELSRRVMDKMQSFYAIGFPNGEEELRKGTLEPISVEISLRPGKRVVTLISNLEPYRIEPATIAKEMQKLAAASTTLTTTPSSGGQVVVIQGDAANEAVKLLTTRFEVPRKFINAPDAKPKKK